MFHPALMVVTDPRDCVWRASPSRLFIGGTETIDFENYIVLGIGLGVDVYTSFYVNSIEKTGTEVVVEIEAYELYPGTAKPCVSFPPTEGEYHLVLIHRSVFYPYGEFHFTLLDTLSGGEMAEATAFMANKGPVYTREIPLETVRSTRRAASKDYLVITSQKEYEQAITDWAKEAIAEIVPEIDFDKYILLVVSGEVPDSCYQLSIINPAIQDGTRIQVIAEIEMESDFGIATVIPTTTFVLAERDSFQPRGELDFVFYRNGNKLGEEMASV